jgi:hypothetical protein
MTARNAKAFLDNLQEQDFYAAAKQGTYVYCYLRNTRSSNGKAGSPYYVGVGSRSDRVWQKHACAVPANKKFMRVMRVCQSWIEAARWEQFYIKHYGRIDLGNGCLRNKTDGGEGCPNPSQEVRDKLSKAQSRPEVIERLRRLAAQQKGKKVKLTAAQKRAIGRPGVKRSKEHAQSISAALKGIKRSKSHVENLNKSRKLNSIRKRSKWAHSVGIAARHVLHLSYGAMGNLKAKAAKGYRGQGLLMNLSKQNGVTFKEKMVFNIHAEAA